MSKTAAKGGKKGRKYDRHRKRSPAADRYRAEDRWWTNKIVNLIHEIRRSRVIRLGKTFPNETYKDQQSLKLVKDLVREHPHNSQMARRLLTKQDNLVREVFI